MPELLTDAALERYGRQLILDGVGEAGQARLRAADVLVVGAGALGSPIVMYLAGAGVGRLAIADGDVVDMSNLARQTLHQESDLGHGKAASAAEAARRLNADVDAVPIPERLDAAAMVRLVAGRTVVCDATDNFEARFGLNDACVIAGVPLVHAAVLQYGGQVLTVVPGGPCYRCLFGEPPDQGAVPTCAQAGILGSVAGVIGSLAATEALKLVLGVGQPLSGRLLIYDGLRPRFREVAVRRDPACRAAHNQSSRR